MLLSIGLLGCRVGFDVIDAAARDSATPDAPIRGSDSGSGSPDASDSGDTDSGDTDSGATDAAPVDSALDTAVPDAPRCPGGPCAERISCTGKCSCDTGETALDCRVGDDCDATCDGTCGCAVDMRRGSNVGVSYNDTARCVVWARNASNVTVTCDASSCDVDCTGASNCTVDCPTGECLVDCSGVSDGNCSLGGCSWMSCSDGTRVWRRACS